MNAKKNMMKEYQRSNERYVTAHLQQIYQDFWEHMELSRISKVGSIGFMLEAFAIRCFEARGSRQETTSRSGQILRAEPVRPDFAVPLQA